MGLLYRGLLLTFILLSNINTAAASSEVSPRSGTTQKKYYILDHSRAQYGMFGSYQAVVGFLDFIEQQNDVAGYEVLFTWGHYFNKKLGPNWWEYYFKPIQAGSPHGAQVVYIDDDQKAAFNIGAISSMSKERAHEIISKYIKLRTNLRLKIEAFYQKYLRGKYVISVHYRGTDKIQEANRVSYEIFFQTIEDVIKTLQHDNYVIYAASDEQQFIDALKERFKHVRYQKAQRSSNGKPLHYGPNAKHGSQQGEETIIDFYLLGKGDILIRGHSNLSASLQNLRPDLRTITLNTTTVGAVRHQS